MMGKTYLDNISVGLKDAQLLLGSGITEVFFSNRSPSTDDNEEKSMSAYHELYEELDAIDLSPLDEDYSDIILNAFTG